MEEYVLGPDPETGGFAVMPLQRVHTIAGGSGVGKSRLIFQLIKACREGQDFLGYPTQWHPMVYCAFDRQVDEQEETMRSVGLDPDVLPHVWLEVQAPPPVGQVDNRMFDAIRDLRNQFPEMRVLIMDAYYIMCPHGNMNDYVIMARWLQQLGKWCRDLDLTIIGIVHKPKERKGNEITDARYSAQGSVATGGFTSCQIAVSSSADPDDKDKRVVGVYPRNAREQEFHLIMNDKGVLVEDVVEADNIALFIERHAFAPKRPMSVSEIVEAVNKRGLKASKSLVKNTLAKMVEAGRLEKLSRGIYMTPADFSPDDYAGLQPASTELPVAAMAPAAEALPFDAN